jgi:3-oxoacyl-[acyl-carrier protein] reductase
MGKLEGRKALVTGGATGIGRAIALAFAKEGAWVAINFRESEREAREVAAEVERLGGRWLILRADVSNRPAVEEMFRHIEAEWGGVDILVNNAGVVRRAGLWELTEEIWDQMMAVNLKGTFLCSKEAARLMVSQGGGCIINIASMRGITGSESSMHYAVSKAGVIALTKCLARELAPLVRANAIAPGYVETRIQQYLSPEARAKIEAETPLRRFGKPEEIGAAAVYLAADATYMTGQVLVVDGGRTMCG